MPAASTGSFPAASDQPLVSVAMITYNHAHYIKEAIESVLTQKTTFAFELIVGDDFSTDGTRQLVMELAKANASIIRPLLHEKNIGMHANAAEVHAACRGKYVAELEGDDFWINPLKLQRQVEFMESNPDCVFCGGITRVMCRSDSGDFSYIGEYKPKRTAKWYSVVDCLNEYFIHTSSVMTRRGVVELPAWTQGVVNLDGVWLAMHGEKGKIGFLHEYVSVYRHHPGGVWAGITAVKRLEALRVTHDRMDDHFRGKYRASLRLIELRHLAPILDGFMRAGDFSHAARIWWDAAFRIGSILPFRFAVLSSRLIVFPIMEGCRRLRFHARVRTRWHALRSRGDHRR